MSNQFPVIQKLPFTTLLLLLASLLLKAQKSIFSLLCKAILKPAKKCGTFNEQGDKGLSMSLSQFSKQKKILPQKLTTKNSCLAALFVGAQRQYFQFNNN
jgi:hypothetical protein